MRQREILDRKSWEAMVETVESRDADTAEVLRDQLIAWPGGDGCDYVDVSLDSTGRLDSESSPRPADEEIDRARRFYAAVWLALGGDEISVYHAPETDEYHAHSGGRVVAGSRRVVDNPTWSDFGIDEDPGELSKDEFVELAMDMFRGEPIPVSTPDPLDAALDACDGEIDL